VLQADKQREQDYGQDPSHRFHLTVVRNGISIKRQPLYAVGREGRVFAPTRNGSAWSSSRTSGNGCCAAGVSDHCVNGSGSRSRVDDVIAVAASCRWSARGQTGHTLSLFRGSRVEEKLARLVAVASVTML
jgi:hypothetical protein